MTMDDCLFLCLLESSVESLLHSRCKELRIYRRIFKQKSRIRLLQSQLVEHVFGTGHRLAGCPFRSPTFPRVR